MAALAIQVVLMQQAAGGGGKRKRKRRNTINSQALESLRKEFIAGINTT